MLAAALDADISPLASSLAVTEETFRSHKQELHRYTIKPLNTRVNVSVGPQRGDSMREEVALLGAPGCGQTAVTEQGRRRRRRQPDSGEERSGAMPRRIPQREQEGETREAAP